MRITYNKLLDISFAMFVVSSILLNGTRYGKIIQFCFVLCSLGTININMKKRGRQTILPYHVLELLFVLYVFLQIWTGMAVSVSITTDMLVTLMYTALFSICCYNYFIYNRDIQRSVKIYAQSTIFALCVAGILYFDTVRSFRLSAVKTISVLGIPLFEGGSSTALAMQAVLPAFFIMLFPPKGSRKSAYPYVITLLLFSLLTGTRKTLIIFAYILIVVYEFMKQQNISKKLVKMILIGSIICMMGYFVVMNISFLYNIIGYRIESAFSFIQMNDTSDSSIRVRNRMIQTTLQLFREKPVFGWGMNYYNTLTAYSYSHNNFLELLSGGGIVGTILYYSKYLYLLICVIRTTLYKKENRMFWVSILGFLILMIVIEYWQVTYFYRYIMIYQILILAMLQLEKRGMLKR